MPFLMPAGYLADHTTLMRLCDDAGNTVFDFTDPALDMVINTVDVGFPAIRESSISATGQDGARDQTQFIGPRTVTAEVTMPGLGYSAVEDELRAYLHPSARYYLHILQPGWSGERRVQVRTGAYACPPALPLVAQIGWVAPTGTFEGAAQSVSLLPTFSDNEGGIATPVALPAAFNPGYNPGAATITVEGTSPTQVTATIYGPCTNPVLFLAGAQARLSFNTTIAAGDFLQVDFGARTALLNNNPLLSMYGYLDFVRSSWWDLSPGDHQVAFNPSLAGSTCMAILSWRPRYI